MLSDARPVSEVVSPVAPRAALACPVVRAARVRAEEGGEPPGCGGVAGVAVAQVPLAQHVRGVAHILQVPGQQLHLCRQPVRGALPEAPLETEPEVEIQTKVCEDFTITEKAPTGAFLG